MMIQTNQEIQESQKLILNLKKEKDVTILAHYYQTLEIQEIADYVGDSLGLSKIARDHTNTKNIIYAGVLFMAETASILNPGKRVLMPDKQAGCPLASFLDGNTVNTYKEKYPGVPAVVYINSTAETKAETDVVCTSSNAIKVVQGIQNEFKSKKVLFGPDENLADYVRQKTGINIINLPDEGFCYVHNVIKDLDVIKVKNEHPNALITVHPECKREVRELADHIGSTKGMYDYVKKNASKGNEFIIGTELGFVQRVQKDFPNNKIYPINENFICRNMKLSTLEKIFNLLNNLNNDKYKVTVPDNTANKARISLEKMLKYS